MAYSNTIFQAIPAVYALLPRPQKRRTATNIMAGYFDPLPTPPSEHDASSSRASSPDDHIHSVPARKSTTTTATTRIGTKKGKLSARKNVRRGPLLAAGLPDHDLPSRKGKAIAHVVSDEKENEIALSDNDGESSDSLSPPPPSPPRANPHLPVSTSASTPKASGFWRARSSNASDAPTLKRKRSAQAEQPSEPRQATLTKAVKKPRVSAPAVVEPRSRIFYSTSPSLASSASLSSAVSEPIEMPEHPTDVQQFSRAVASYTERTPAGVSCKLCSLRFLNASLLEAHFTERHREQIVMEMVAQPQPQAASAPPPRKKGQRRNVAIKKGWKGWVEEDLEPQKLILLDKPEVLPERTTRSGRKI